MVHLTFYTYELQLEEPFKPRKGIVIEWPDGDWTEASPLEPWSPDRFDDVLRALKTSDWKAPLPALQFGLEKLEHVQTPFPYCPLLAGTPSTILEKSKGLKRAKVKLSKIPLPQAIAVIKELSKRIRLRIDFNRSLTLEEALYLAKECQSDAIEFYEEPLKNSQELRHFPYPVALDESLREEGFEALACLPHVVALVLKPTMIGSLAACKSFERFGKPIVLSSSFESGIGLAQILRFAPHFQSILPLGIDTYRYLKEDLLQERLRVQDNGYVFSTSPFPRRSFLRIAGNSSIDLESR